jgi:hypothetical protein
MKVMGMIENMGTFTCPHCGKPVNLFKKGGGKRTAEHMSVPFLGTIPFFQDMVKACDNGKPVLAQEGDTEFHKAFGAIVDKIIEITGSEQDIPANSDGNM